MDFIESNFLFKSLITDNTCLNPFINFCLNNISILTIFLVIFFIIYKIYVLLTFTDIVVDLSDTCFNKNGMKTSNRMSGWPPFYPNCWIPILESRDIRINQTKPVIAFGYELVVFRGNSGKVYVSDAFCPHMGANLGVGGEVVDDCGHDCIRCPFHGWTFRGKDGMCQTVPKLDCSESKSLKAQLKIWDNVEMNGFIYVWHNTNQLKPEWFPIKIQEIEDSKWVYKGRTEHIANCHFQEISENAADVEHLNEIHRPANFLGTVINKFAFYDHIIKYAYFEWDANWSACSEPNEHIADLTLESRFYIFGYPLITMNFTMQQIGPAFLHTKFSSPFLGGVTGILVFTTTPVEPMKNRIVHHCYANPSFRATLFSKFVLNGVARMIERDIIIWNNKKFVKSAIFTKNDKRLVKYRRWMSQFYSDKNQNQLEW